MLWRNELLCFFKGETSLIKILIIWQHFIRYTLILGSKINEFPLRVMRFIARAAQDVRIPSCGQIERAFQWTSFPFKHIALEGHLEYFA